MKQKKIQSELNEALKYNLSFAGCGFLGIYHVGVAVCFRKYAPQLLLQKISGASAGALAACCLLSDLPLGEMTSDFFRIVNEARSHSLGPFSPSFDIQSCLMAGMSKHLPEDAHLKVNGKLHISLTRIYDGKSVIVSQFNSREDLLDALLCACFIPGFSGLIPPKFHGVRYMDGAFSDNLPTLDENTVTVSPFCGESDICPRDDSTQMFHVNLNNTSIELSRQNIYRFVRILFPPKPEILSNMCQQGFDDALHFLHRNHLISCTRCLAIQSTFILSKQTPEHYDPECKTCSHHRDESLVDKSLPDSVLSVMEKYIMEKSSSGIFKWFQSPALFLIRGFISATLPCDFVYAGLSKILTTAPNVKNNIWGLTKYVLDNLYCLILPRDDNFKDLDIYTKQIREMYENDPILKKFDHVGPRRSIADICPSDHEYDESDFEVRGNVLSRRNSSVPMLSSMLSSQSHMGNLEVLDNLASSANPHNTLYSYHYLDSNDKTIKFNKIFDMSDTGSIEDNENYTNQMLQFDDSEFTAQNENENQIQHDLARIIPESKEIMNDWTCSEIKIDEIHDGSSENFQAKSLSSSTESLDSFSYKPEADQSEHEQILSENVLDVLKKDTKNYSMITENYTSD